MPTTTPLSALAEPAIDGADDNVPPHADYNLHPLKVDGLEHYLPPSEEAEEDRFHVR